MNKTKALNLTTLIIGGLLVLVQLPAMRSLVSPTNGQAIGYDVVTVGLLALGVYAFVAGGRGLIGKAHTLIAESH